jgi:plasmid stabilization system protein ParE
MTRYRVVRRETGDRDLEDIVDWLAAEPPDAARRFIAAVRAVIGPLEALPERFEARTYPASGPVRSGGPARRVSQTS